MLIEEQVDRQVEERRKWLGPLRPRFRQPEALFFWRLIETALEEAQDWDMIHSCPTDDALLARDWIARETPHPMHSRLQYLTSLEHACYVLELPLDEMRERLLAVVDGKHDHLNETCTSRLSLLVAQPLDGDDEEMFEALRVVPVRDQGAFEFGMETLQ